MLVQLAIRTVHRMFDRGPSKAVLLEAFAAEQQAAMDQFNRAEKLEEKLGLADAEIERLSTLLANPEMLGLEIKKTIEGHETDLRMKHWASKLMVHSFADSFRSIGGTNYVELEIGDEEFGHFIVTIQKRFGKSPGQMHAELKDAMPPPRRLRHIAKLIDHHYPNDPNTEMQDDLRRWANKIESLLTPTTTQD